MITLSYGFEKPETNDTGATVFPAMESNIQKLNDHNHNGINSSLIPSSAITAATQTISSAGWALVANGIYKQTVTLLAGMDYDEIGIQFHLVSDGRLVTPTVRRVTDSQYDVYLNDNTQSLLAIYI